MDLSSWLPCALASMPPSMMGGGLSISLNDHPGRRKDN